jgi:hypothetical protein
LAAIDAAVDRVATTLLVWLERARQRRELLDRVGSGMAEISPSRFA